jgi:hypothetical protein
MSGPLASITIALDPGDTSYIDPSIDWRRARLTCLAMIEAAVRSEWPGADVSVTFNNRDETRVRATDARGPLAADDPRLALLRTAIAESWQAWRRGLPSHP